jgi:hypothetical protein
MDRRRKVELFEQIRREYRLGIGTIRGVAKQFGVHRRIVRQALASAIPPERKTLIARGGDAGEVCSASAGNEANTRVRWKPQKTEQPPTMLAAGDIAQMPAFWSHPEVSQSTAVVTGRLPPVTKPK